MKRTLHKYLIIEQIGPLSVCFFGLSLILITGRLLQLTRHLFTSSLTVGDLLEIVGDDPGIREDLPAWCDHAGHRLVEMADEGGGKIRGLVEKGLPRRKR